MLYLLALGVEKSLFLISSGNGLPRREEPALTACVGRDGETGCPRRPLTRSGRKAVALASSSMKTVTGSSSFWKEGKRARLQKVTGRWNKERSGDALPLSSRADCHLTVVDLCRNHHASQESGKHPVLTCVWIRDKCRKGSMAGSLFFWVCKGKGGVAIK